jgi:hypothetical protein
MTLIAGFKCREGYVIAADSQVTSGDYRSSHLKLSPWQSGNFEIAMAGSGENGDVVDAFEERLKTNLSTLPIESLEELKEFIHRELVDFHTNELGGYPPDDMRFIIGARSKPRDKSVLWSTKFYRLKDIETYELVGAEDVRYDFAAEGYYRRDITIAQGIFLSLHIMWLAERTSNLVKAPIAVTVLRDNGVHPQAEKQIHGLHERVKLFAAQFERLFLACPDTGLQHGEFAAKVNEFVSTIGTLRADYVSESVGAAVEEGLDKIADPYTLIPAGMIFSLDPNSAEQKRLQENLINALRANEDGKQDPERVCSNLRILRESKHRRLSTLTGEGETGAVEDTLAVTKAFEEIYTAASMGPYRTTQEVVNLLGRVVSFASSDFGLGEHVNLQLQIAVIDQTMQFVQSLPNGRGPAKTADQEDEGAARSSEP